jgi:hypothetical protein
MLTVELYAGIRRAVMVEELHYILLIAVKGELGLFNYFSPQQSAFE